MKRLHLYLISPAYFTAESLLNDRNYKYTSNARQYTKKLIVWRLCRAFCVLLKNRKRTHYFISLENESSIYTTSTYIQSRARIIVSTRDIFFLQIFCFLLQYNFSAYKLFLTLHEITQTHLFHSIAFWDIPLFLAIVIIIMYI